MIMTMPLRTSPSPRRPCFPPHVFARLRATARPRRKPLESLRRPSARRATRRAHSVCAGTARAPTAAQQPAAAAAAVVAVAAAAFASRPIAYGFTGRPRACCAPPAASTPRPAHPLLPPPVPPPRRPLPPQLPPLPVTTTTPASSPDRPPSPPAPASPRRLSAPGKPQRNAADAPRPRARVAPRASPCTPTAAFPDARRRRRYRPPSLPHHLLPPRPPRSAGPSLLALRLPSLLPRPPSLLRPHSPRRLQQGQRRHRCRPGREDSYSVFSRRCFYVLSTLASTAAAAAAGRVNHIGPRVLLAFRPAFRCKSPCAWGLGLLVCTSRL